MKRMRLSGDVVIQGCRKTAAAVSAVALLLATAFPISAQEQQPAAAPKPPQQSNAGKAIENPVPQKALILPIDFTKGKGYLPNPLGIYTERQVPATSFENTPRI